VIPITDILSRLKGVKPSGRGHVALCPAHDDKNPSLSITEGDDGKILVHCHHGCTAEEIAAALGIEMRDLMPDTRPTPQCAKRPPSKIVATYPYRDADGNLVYHVVRMDPKDFRQRRPHPDGEHWIWGLTAGKYYQGRDGDWRPAPRDYTGETTTFPAVKPTIYRLPEILQCKAHGRPIVIVEGEKDVDSLTRLGIPATCNSGGAGKFHLLPPEVLEVFRGMRVGILPDNDVPGRKHGEAVVSILSPLAAEIRITTVPDPHKDVSDWIAAGAVRAEISKLLSGTPILDLTPKDDGTPAPAAVIDVDFMRAPSAPFRCVGFVKGENFYFHRGKKCVLSFQAREHTPIALQSLAAIQWWEHYFMGRQGVDWDAARNALFRIAEQAGPYDARRVRGCGAWYDDGRIVLHRGDHLIVDGEQMQVDGITSRFIYEATWASGDNGAEPLSTDEARHLLDLSDLLSWRHGVNARLFAGWCFLAPVCGALAWRPHIWITGASGTGKSWIVQHILKPTLGRGTLEAQSSTTEAGIRQSMGTNAFPVLLDEAEGEDQRAQMRIQGIIELARQASSESGAPILKGTTRGAAMTFIIRSCFAFSSIGVAAVQKADLSRISVLELAKPHPKDAQDRFDEICEAALVLTPEWCARLRARAVTSIPRILENSRIFARVAADYFRDTRIGDQIGALLAGSYCIDHDDVISPTEAARLIADLDWAEQSVVEAETDEMQCLSTILVRTVQVGQDGRRYDRSIGDLINFVVADIQGIAPTDPDLKDREATDTLARLGIRIIREQLCISDSHAELKRLLANTPWATNWRHQLRRIEGAESKNCVRFGSYYTSRATVIPLDKFAKAGEM
jgi:putative DNA primase/helicase